MKTYTYSLLVFLLTSVMLTSCLGGNEEVVYSDNCNISTFSLGSIRQIHHVKGSKGQDSTYYTVFAGSTFPMSVDQRTQTIENRDSLPYNSLVSKVLTNCTFESVLVHRPKDISGLEPADTAWLTYSAKDSIDFTKPREFMVIAATGDAARRYTVKVNVHQMDPDATVWDSLGVSSLAGLTACKTRKMAIAGDKLVTLTQQEDGQTACFQRTMGKGAEWQQVAMSGAEGANLETLQQNEGQLYVSTNEGRVLYSIDGQEWRNRLNGKAGLQLVGVSHTRFYAIVEGKLMSCARSEEVWKEEKLDEEADKLPVKDIATLTLTQNNGNQRLLLTGKSDNGKAARLWAKTWQGDAENEAGWAYYTENNAIKNTFPLLSQSCVLPYNKGILAFGGTPEVASSQWVKEALGCMYFSEDQGVTWKNYPKMKFDESMTEAASNAQLISATVEDGRFIWMLIDGQLWRGRLNSVVFK